MNDDLKELTSKLEGAFHDQLVSVILYGSGASDDHHKDFSDLNVLCVLKHVTMRELGAGEPVSKWWAEQGHPAPLMLSEEEVHRSSDSFPIEFHDMKARRSVLYGLDVIADLVVDPKYYRAQLEHELRSKLLRLRQQGARALSDPVALMRLCLDSVSTFCVLGRHALSVGGADVKPERRAVVKELGRVLKMDTEPLDVLLDIREKQPTHKVVPVELFAKYLECVHKMVDYVDRLE